MKTRFSSLKKVAVAFAAAACAVVFPVLGQDEESAETEETVAEGEPAAEEAPAAGEDQVRVEKFYYSLIRCNRVWGEAEALKPRTEKWEPLVEGKYYPLGTSFRTVTSVPPKAKETKLEIGFGRKVKVTILGEGEFGTKLAEFGAPAREIILARGKIAVELPRTAQEGVFTVTAPYFSAVDLAGESSYEYTALGDGDEAVVRCVTGTMKLAGVNYKAPKMVAANQVRIRSTADNLFTSLRGESGDCKLVIDQGVGGEKNFETGEIKEIAKSLDFTLSPKCAVKIFRRKSAVGGRMVVSTMTFDAQGAMKNRCTFAENRSNVNTGELVVPDKITEEKGGKSAAEAAEDVEAVELEPEPEEEAAGGDAGEAAEEDAGESSGDDEEL